MRIIKTLATGALALVVAGGASVTAAEEVKLKAASFLPVRAVFAKYFGRWVDAVNEKCDGEVEVSVVGPEAIGSLEQWNALKSGVIDLHYGPPNYYKGTLVEADVTILASNSAADQRANGAWEILNELHNEKMNAQYLTHLIAGVNFYVYTSKPKLDGDKPFDGFTLRSVPIYDIFFESLGAQPVRMAPPKLYTALERNEVDGYGWPSWGVHDFSWDKFTKYRHGPGFFSANVNIIANLDTWNSKLSDKGRQCLTDMAIWLEGEWPKWRDAETDAQIGKQDASGIQYVDMGADFADRAHELYWADLMKQSPEVIGKLRPLMK